MKIRGKALTAAQRTALEALVAAGVAGLTAGTSTGEGTVNKTAAKSLTDMGLAREVGSGRARNAAGVTRYKATSLARRVL